MKNHLILLLNLTILIVSCDSLATKSIHLTPKEVCVVSDQSDHLQCAFEGKAYNREIKGGDIVTNYVDYIQGVNEIADLIKELKTCRAGL